LLTYVQLTTHWLEKTIVQWLASDSISVALNTISLCYFRLLQQNQRVYGTDFTVSHTVSQLESQLLEVHQSGFVENMNDTNQTLPVSDTTQCLRAGQRDAVQPIKTIDKNYTN